MDIDARSGPQSVEAREEELARTKRELALVRAQLQRLQQRKSSLLAMAAHDLRTPLAIIQGYSQLLAVGLTDETDAATREYLTTIVGHSTVLGNTIENLVALDQIERGEMGVSAVRCDLSELVLAALAQVEGLARVKGLAVHCVTPPTPLWVFADENQVGRVLYNLLSHGEKYAREGSELSIEVMREGDYGCVKLIDPRRVLAADMIARIFDLIEVTPEGRASVKGTDMGLVVARYVAEAHGGSVTVASSVADGTCFTLCLPCSEA